MENVETQPTAQAQAETGSQEHPIGIYLKVWILLFVLSFFSYLVDFFDLQVRYTSGFRLGSAGPTILVMLFSILLIRRYRLTFS